MNVVKEYDIVVGDPVQWFVAGNRNVPSAAQVLTVNPGGMLVLLVWDENGHSRRVGNCWHADNQILKDNPELARKNGCWNFLRANRPLAQNAAIANSPANEEAPVDQPPAEKPKLQKKSELSPV